MKLRAIVLMMLYPVGGAAAALGAGPSNATSGWLTTAPLPEATKSPRVAQESEALLDLVHLYRAQLDIGGARLALSERLATSRMSVHRELTAADLRDPRTDVRVVARLLLRLRLLEAMSLVVQRPALDYVSLADSLQRVLLLKADLGFNDPGTTLLLAAGMPVTEARWPTIQAELYAGWRKALFDRAGSGAETAFWLFHVLYPRDPRVVDDLNFVAPQGLLAATLRELAQALQSGRVSVWQADAPVRRLTAGLRGIEAQQPLPAWIEAAVRRSANNADYPSAMATLDSIANALGGVAQGPLFQSGSNRGGAASEPQVALAIARQALDDLRAQRSEALLRQEHIGLEAVIDPAEAVPGQLVRVTWLFRSPRALAVEGWSGSLFGRHVTLEGLPLIPADSTVRVASSHVPMPEPAFDSTLLAVPQLECSLAGRGRVWIRRPEKVRAIQPLQAFLDVRDGSLLGSAPKQVHLRIASRSPQPVEGSFSVLPTAEWLVTPARDFHFRLRRPGQAIEQELQLALAPDASPGPYEVAVRVLAGGRDVGMLQTTLTRPVRWLTVGPLAAPLPGETLAPEKGFGFDQWYRDASHNDVTWQLAPQEAFDQEGALDFAALYGVPLKSTCACALTVFESSARETVQLDLQGSKRLLWNGVPVAAGALVPLQAGSNTALVSVCSQSQGWRLLLQVRSASGAIHPAVSNDLNRLLQGLGEFRTARAADTSQIERWVTVRYDAGPAGDVAVMGSFNAWVPVALDKLPDGTWKKELLLKPGRYAYKLVVDGSFRPDPGARVSEPDGFGGINSLLIVR